MVKIESFIKQINSSLTIEDFLMKYSQSWIVTQKNKSAGVEAISHDLSLRAGLIHQVSSGI